LRICLRFFVASVPRFTRVIFLYVLLDCFCSHHKSARPLSASEFNRALIRTRMPERCRATLHFSCFCDFYSVRNAFFRLHMNEGKNISIFLLAQGRALFFSYLGYKSSSAVSTRVAAL
jgi:hypothetical protein